MDVFSGLVRTNAARSSFRARAADPPNGGVLALPDGAFIGITANGGSGSGTIYRIEADGSERVLHAFDLQVDGVAPSFVRPLLASDGRVYGTTGNGPDFQGAIWRMNPDGSDFTVLYRFLCCAGPGSPMSTLIEGTDGNLYGTAQGGFRKGSIYRMTPARSPKATAAACSAPRGRAGRAGRARSTGCVPTGRWRSCTPSAPTARKASIPPA
jgi:uncharacterized repeat protein (TIGR03803 family)